MKINIPKDVAWYSTDMVWVWAQIRNIFEKVKLKINSLISKK